MRKKEKYHNATLAVAFFIVLLAFGILLLFSSYKDEIIGSNSFTSFISLSFIGMGLLLWLLFLINRNITEHHKKNKKRR